MRIREAEWNTCKSCKQRTGRVHDEAYGCDKCGKEINLSNPERDCLRAAIYHKDNETKWLHYCSWQCCLKDLKNKKTDYFISLPFIMFGDEEKGRRPQDFWKLIK